MSAAAVQEATGLAAQFKRAVEADDDGAEALLKKLKALFTRFDSLPPFLSGAGGDAAARQQALARGTFEQAALLSVKTGDMEGFERHFAQLRVYYSEPSVASALPPSGLMYGLLGLNLLHLVVESRLSEFHSELELLPAGAREQGPIKFPLEIEQQLMEGSYSEVLSVTREGPTTEFGRHAKPLVDKLEDTVRDEIASCAEKAYKSLSVDAAVALMHLDDAAALREYIAEEKEGLWLVGADDRVRFADAGAGAGAGAGGGGGDDGDEDMGDDGAAAAGPAAGAGEGSDVNAHVTMAQNIKYATELERIV